MTASRPEVIRLDRAEAALGGRRVWSDVSLEVGRGEFVAVLGPNGAGKSTLLKVILGLVPLAAGTASVLGERPGARNESIGYLPQRREFDPSVRVRGVDLVRLGLDGGRWGIPLPEWLPAGNGRRRAAARVGETLELVGAAAHAERPIGELSGGEQQRILIAQALVRGPRVLMLDEPLDSLDLPSQRSVAALLQRICRIENVAVLLVTHDVNPILPYLDRVTYFAGASAVAGRPEDVITSPALSKLYGVPIEVLHASDGRLVVVGQPEAPHVHSPRHG
ncbi:MAG: ABC transporter ATP-binding protein [Actinobacteria bacterium]|nr:MAG: ABC transporter ATP-binding protein [Actinomycetota bacterium]